MKCIIAGSRSITDYNLVKEAVQASGFLDDDLSEFEVVSGMARGVDTLAILYSKEYKLKLHKFPANWELHGKKAGILRNIEMGEFSDALIAIYDGKSKGTRQMIDWAKKNGLRVYVHYTIEAGEA